MPLDFGFHLPIRYYGPRGTVRQFSVARVLNGDLDPDLVRGQVVILGATALGTGDTFAIPFDRVVPGVEILATAVSNLLAGDGLVRTGLVRKIDAAAAIVLPGLLILLLANRRAAVGAWLAGAVLATWIAAVYAAFLAGYWISIAVPLAAVLPTVTTYGLGRLVIDRTRRAAADRRKDGARQVPIAGPGRSTSCPIRNSSSSRCRRTPRSCSWTCRTSPEFAKRSGRNGRAICSPISRRVIDRDVVAHGGHVASFMGDGAMIVFGLPSARPDDAIAGAAHDHADPRFA